MVALVIVCLANVTAILSQGYASMVALKGGGGRLFRTAAWPWLIAVILGPAAILVFFPTAVYDDYGRFLSWGAIVLAPLCGVNCNGVNVAAFVAVVAGAVTYSLLLNPVSYEPSGLFRYTTASLPAFVVAGIVHYVLTQSVVRRLGLGGYDTQCARR